jgi:hypothetical protein
VSEYLKEGDAFNCDACGEAHTKACGGGMLTPPGATRAILYLLCERCATEVEKNPQRIIAQVEIRHAVAQGAA